MGSLLIRAAPDPQCFPEAESRNLCSHPKRFLGCARNDGLVALPWEFLYDPRRGYVCLSTSTPLVRYIALPQPVRPLTVTPPLRVLGMEASPENLALKHERHEKGGAASF
jgi:hypothetical protein